MKTFITLLITIALTTKVYAAGQVEQYCIWDYFRFCSQYSIGSNEVKQCMADAGVKLSKECIRAIVADGYVTKQEVIHRGKQQGYIVAETKNGLDIIGTIPKTQVLKTKTVNKPKVAKVKVTKKAIKKKTYTYKTLSVPTCQNDLMQSSLTGMSFFNCK